MTDPIIPFIPRRIELVATPGQTAFQFDFDGVEAPTDLRVYLNGDRTTAFTLAPANKMVTLNAGAAGGDSIVIEGQLDIDRARGYPRGGALSTDRLNPEFNKIFRILQELRRDINRAIVLNKGQIGASTTLPLFIEEGYALVSSPDGVALSQFKLTALDGALAYVQDSVEEVQEAIETMGGIVDEVTGLRDQTQEAASMLPLNNYTAITGPGAADETDGYSVGSKWVNIAASPDPEAYICLRAAAGNSLWEITTLDIDDLGSAAIQDVGGAVGNVVQLGDDGSGNPRYPAGDGSLLTGVGFKGVKRTFFSSSGTFTPDPAAMATYVRGVGGGGNGGGSISDKGGGGGSGFFVDAWIAAPIEGTVAVTIGGAGSTSLFGEYLSCAGGVAGAAGGGYEEFCRGGKGGYRGGNSAYSVRNADGSAAQEIPSEDGAGSGGAGGIGVSPGGGGGGGGGVPGWGNGGAGGTSSNGAAGTGYGSGGGGAGYGSGGSGGAGTGGAIEVIEYLR